ncbi:hypothetical protein KDA_02910 [Dictyobacter alpinus]|uniref:Uncharacterized protein n=1 Tax=Dictyobacter alpinus TaxID=2014873 RepID=A0A402B0G5_9CHLR|nr:hypothetical protein [Dictyobacter alpinus]GCE24807.1 hypothetical protein KDA_02910 [Dictyobacter alpinus]
MSTIEKVELQDHPTQIMNTLALKKTDTLFRKFLTFLVLVGACCVIALYLVVPLMLLLNIFQDWITQLLCAVLILAIGEFIIFSILIKTSKATKVGHATKHAGYKVLEQDREDEQHIVPFDELVNTATVHVPALKNEDVEDQTPLSDDLADETTVHMSALKPSSGKFALIHLDEEPTQAQDKVSIS